MKKNKKPEKAFEEEFAWRGKIKKCLYVKIPDPIMTGKRLQLIKERGVSDELRRTFDGILVKSSGNYCLEFKCGYNQLTEHQKDYRMKINAINNSFYIVRKIIKKGLNGRTGEIIYKLTTPKNKVIQSNNLETIIDYIGGNNE